MEHNRRANAALLAVAHNLSTSDLNRQFGLGLGTFRAAVLSCFQTMVLWSDQIDGGAPRRLLVFVGAEGRVVASETGTVRGLQTMSQAVADEFEMAVARIRPRLTQLQDWTLPDGSIRNSTAEEALFHILFACGDYRSRALLILQALGVSIAVQHAIGFVPLLQSDPSRQDQPQDSPEVSS